MRRIRPSRGSGISASKRVYRVGSRGFPRWVDAEDEAQHNGKRDRSDKGSLLNQERKVLPFRNDLCSTDADTDACQSTSSRKKNRFEKELEHD